MRIPRLDAPRIKFGLCKWLVLICIVGMYCELKIGLRIVWPCMLGVLRI